MTILTTCLLQYGALVHNHWKYVRLKKEARVISRTGTLPASYKNKQVEFSTNSKQAFHHAHCM